MKWAETETAARGKDGVPEASIALASTRKLREPPGMATQRLWEPSEHYRAVLGRDRTPVGLSRVDS